MISGSRRSWFERPVWTSWSGWRPLSPRVITAQPANRSHARHRKWVCRRRQFGQALCSLPLTRPARPRPAGGRTMLLVFPSWKGFCFGFHRTAWAKPPQRQEVYSHRFHPRIPPTSPNFTGWRTGRLFDGPSRALCRNHGQNFRCPPLRWGGRKNMRRNRLRLPLGLVVGQHELAGRIFPRPVLYRGHPDVTYSPKNQAS